MPIPSRASAWVLASSLLLLCAGASAQLQQGERSGGAAAPSATPGLGGRSTGIGRDQFIAPVMGIQIEGDGLNLPPEAAEEPDPAKAAAKPAPAAEKKPETKEPEPRSTGK